MVFHLHLVFHIIHTTAPYSPVHLKNDKGLTFLLV